MTVLLAQDVRLTLRARAVAPWLGLATLSCTGVLLVDRVSTFYSELVLLTMGPLLAAAGVGFSYSSSLDADYALVVASPYSTRRLLLLRAGVYGVATSVALLLCGAGLGRPGLGARVLVCATAVLASGLAASTFLGPPLALALVSSAWLAAITVVLGVGELHDLTGTAGLKAAAGAALLAGAMLAARQQVLSTDWRYS
jgi:hypothetical protein